MIQFSLRKISAFWWIFLLALVTRLIYFLSLRNFAPHEFLTFDSASFDYYARLLASDPTHEKIVQGIPITPLYTLFVSLTYSLLGHLTFFPKLIQIFLGSLSCAFLYKIGALVWNKEVGIWAGIISALSGIFIFYDLEILHPSLANSLLIIALYFLIASSGRLQMIQYLMGIFLFILALFLREQLIPLLPLALISVFFFTKQKKIVAVGSFFLALLLSVSLYLALSQGLTPWLAKSRAMGSVGGIHLYIGNNPKANGSYARLSGISPTAEGHFFGANKVASEAEGRPLSAKETNRYWYKKTFEFIITQPVSWLKIEGYKLFHLLNVYEIPNDENYPYLKRKSWFLALPLISFGFIFPFGMLGIWLARGQFTAASKFLLWFVFLYSGVLLATFVTGAYRLPLHAPLILFSSLALVSIKETILR